MRMRYLILLPLSLFLCGINVAQAEASTIRYESCLAPIKVEAEKVSLRLLLEQLADEMGYVLVSDPSIERTIDFSGEYKGEDLLRQLLRGENAVISYRTAVGCPNGRTVAEVALLKPGQMSSSPSVERYIPSKAKPSQSKKRRKKSEGFVIIDDMDQYLEEVVAGERKARKATMTPEQREEFMRMKKERKLWR